MPASLTIDKFLKSSCSRSDIENERNLRMEDPTAISSEITEEDNYYVLTTTFQVITPPSSPNVTTASAPANAQRLFRGPVAADEAPAVAPDWSEDYETLWSTMVIRPEWLTRADEMARRIVVNHGRYATAVAGTSVPWWFIGLVHAMECDLSFNGHLHNGDPLTARTVNKPKGRPAYKAPPFTWEESARDAIAYENLDKITDWSLRNVLHSLHRYNGIDNEYKKHGIPTPYLWSGCQHYTSGKYVADGDFRLDTPSQQVGAAVLLRRLIDLKAVSLDTGMALDGNPAAAIGHIESLTINTNMRAFEHVAAELDYPGSLVAGSPEKQAVTRVQEWLNIHGLVTAIDGDFGPSTTRQLSAFQIKANRPATGQLDPEVWALLTAPMRRALSTIDHGPSSSLEEAVVKVARQHINEMPVEVGGNNKGPWVRLYMDGTDGADQRWCAGFVCFVVTQAARDLGIETPFNRQVGVDELVADAKERNRFISERDVTSTLSRQSKLRPGEIFVVRASDDDWTHTGIILEIHDDTFDTLEGNTGGDGGSDGPNARQGNRSYAKKDFLRLI